MDTDYFLDTLQWIFVGTESLCLVIFSYYVYEYFAIRRKSNPLTKQPRDTYTISCFIFIILTITARIVLKLIQLIIKQLRIQYRNQFNKDPQWFLDNLNTITCEAKISSYVPTGLFAIAIFINATRWFHLIRVNLHQQKRIEDSHSTQSFKSQRILDEEIQGRASLNRANAIRPLSTKTGFSEQENKQHWKKVHYYTLIGFAIAGIGLLTGFKVDYECNNIPRDDIGFQILEYFYVFSLLGLGIYAIGVYMYASQFFPDLYSNSETLKSTQVLQLKDNSGALIRLRTKEILEQKVKEAKLASQDAQIQKQVFNLRMFFWCLSIIIFIKYLVHLLYDLVFYYYQNNSRLTIYIFVISFYLTEIALVLLMSRSIQETLKAEKQYQYLYEVTTFGLPRPSGPLGKPDLRYKHPNFASGNMITQSLLSSSEQTRAGSPHQEGVTRQQLLREQSFIQIEQSRDSLFKKRAFFTGGTMRNYLPQVQENSKKQENSPSFHEQVERDRDASMHLLIQQTSTDNTIKRPGEDDLSNDFSKYYYNKNEQ